ncbi:hypothetical protein D3C76_899790 [compost metagenome]
MTLPEVSTRTRIRTVPCSSFISASRGYSGFSQPAEPSETPRVTPVGFGAGAAAATGAGAATGLGDGVLGAAVGVGATFVGCATGVTFCTGVAFSTCFTGSGTLATFSTILGGSGGFSLGLGSSGFGGGGGLIS